MNSHRLTRQLLPAAIFAVLLSGTALAQDNPAPTSNTSPPTKTAQRPEAARTLEQVVVTGAASTGGVRKIDASYAISTLSLDAIKDIAPSSTADLLKAIPSVWVESS
ncbi:MAG: TonB-dependent receptor, partial [Rhodanobacter sp.]